MAESNTLVSDRRLRTPRAAAIAEVTDNLSSGFAADNFGWARIPVANVILAGLGLIMAPAGRKIRDRLVAEAAMERKAAASIAATVPEIRIPPKELFESEL